MDTSTSNIILFPDFEKLKNEVEKLRTEFSMLVLERDELRYVICKNIEMSYMMALGSLNYKVYEAECEALRLARKIELIQAKKNRQEKIIISQIEETLDKEFQEYQEKLDEQIDKMNDALKRDKGKKLSKEDTKEIKKLYRNIVKQLHPDLNPNISNSQLTLFENAVTAYKNGDLRDLKIINELVEDKKSPDKEDSSMTPLLKEKERLEQNSKLIKEAIEDIKTSYPYILKDLVESPQKIEERKIKLKSELEQYQIAIQFYTAKVKEMLR